MSEKRTSRTKQKTPSALVSTLPANKAEKVQAEQARLMGLFTGADANKLDFIRAEVQKLAWLNVSIVELQKEIDDTGSVVEYNHGGGQTGVTTNPACKLLVDYQKLSNATFRALLPVLPEKREEFDKLYWFLQDARTPEEIAAEEAEEEAREKAEEERRNAEFAAAKKRLDEMHKKYGNGQ